MSELAEGGRTELYRKSYSAQPTAWNGQRNCEFLQERRRRQLEIGWATDEYQRYKEIFPTPLPHHPREPPLDWCGSSHQWTRQCKEWRFFLKQFVPPVEGLANGKSRTAFLQGPRDGRQFALEFAEQRRGARALQRPEAPMAENPAPGPALLPQADVPPAQGYLEDFIDTCVLEQQVFPSGLSRPPAGTASRPERRVARGRPPSTRGREGQKGGGQKEGPAQSPGYSGAPAKERPCSTKGRDGVDGRGKGGWKMEGPAQPAVQTGYSGAVGVAQREALARVPPEEFAEFAARCSRGAGFFAASAAMISEATDVAELRAMTELFRAMAVAAEETYSHRGGSEC